MRECLDLSEFYDLVEGSSGSQNTYPHANWTGRVERVKLVEESSSCIRK